MVVKGVGIVGFFPRFVVVVQNAHHLITITRPCVLKKKTTKNQKIMTSLISKKKKKRFFL